MVLVELSFTADERRLAARPAHREQVHRLRAEGTLLLAGPWEDDSGAALIFDADLARVEQIMDADPYYTTPGVHVTAVREWHPVVGGPAA